jgi:hypothetical protein
MNRVPKDRCGHSRDDGIGDRHDPGRSWPPVNGGELAERLACANVCQDDLSSVCPPEDARVSADDEGDVIVPRAFFDDQIACLDLAPEAASVQRRDVFRVKLAEQRQAAQSFHAFAHVLSPSPPLTRWLRLRKAAPKSGGGLKGA